MNTQFAELGLNEHILAGVDALGFTVPTPVQAQAIPVILEGRDVVASAQTGTGKTAAFALPVLQMIGRLADAPANRGLSDGPAPAPAAPAVDDSPDATSDSPSDGEPADGAPDAAPKKRRRRRRRKSASSQADDATSEGSENTGAAAGGQPQSQPHKPWRDPGPHALVITPTRELAQQIDAVASVVARQTGQSVVAVIGGEKYDRQLKGIKQGCDMLVATPGRLIDLMERNDVRLDRVGVLVLDEADRMLDMGFWPSVRKIVASIPKDRQTLLFSATISGDIKNSMPTMLKDPVNVEISRSNEAAATVDQRLVPVVQGQKIALLNHLIAAQKPERVLVFCRTKQRVDSVAGALERSGLKVDVMHADRQQKQRQKALQDFRDGKLQALVATDVMSRGIDVSDIDWVVNFDVPMDPEDYVHRIGRTGRAGQTGIAFTFLAPDEVSPLREIEYFTKKLVPVWEPEGFEFGPGRIVPNPSRAASRSAYSMFSGSRSSRGRGPSGGRFGRHT